MNINSDVKEKSTQLKVLFIDDEKTISRYFLRVYGGEFNVVVAQTPIEALEILEQKSDSIAIILTDQRMAGMTGQELLNRVKARYPNIIRMMTSAFVSDTELELLQIETGIFKYIEKPWDIDLLRSSLHEAMNTFLMELNDD